MKRSRLTIIAASISIIIGWFANDTFILGKGMKEDGVQRFQNHTKSEAITGTWVVKDLLIPECKPCDSVHMKLNKLMNYNLNIFDTLVFGKDTAVYRSIQKKFFRHAYRLRSNRIIFYGSDWVYDMEFKLIAPTTLSLLISQEYISNVENTLGPKTLAVCLVKIL